MNPKYKTVEDGIRFVQQESKTKPISIGEIIRLLPGKGLSMILIFLSLPFYQPLQIPGFAIPFGLAIAYGGLRLAFGHQIWIPHKILSKTISKKKFKTITSKVLAILEKINPWIHSRLSWICKSSSMKVLNGLTIFFLGLLLSMPLPIPLSNLTAAWSIFLIGLGLLKDDGLLVALGYVVTLTTATFFVLMALSIQLIF